MPKEILKRGATSNILRVFLQDSASTTGAGKTALTSASSGLIISTIADLEATATTYTSAATNVETVTTLGTFAAPTAGKCRFREVDATNFPGVYEIHIADARFNVANATQLLISIQCTGVAPVYVEYQLVAVDLMDTVRFGLTALPNTAVTTNGSLITAGTGTAQLSTTSGVALANTTQWNGTGVTGMPMPTYTQPSGFLSASFPAGTIANTTNITAGTITTVSGNVNGSVNSVATTVSANTTQWGGTAVTGMPLPTASYTTPPTAASISTQVWSETTRVLTAGTNISLAKNTGITGFNDITAQSVWDVLASSVTATNSIGLQLKTNVDAQISTRLASSSYTAPLTTAGTAQAVWNAATASYAVGSTFGERILRSSSAQATVAVTGSNHVAADIHELQPAVISAGDFADSALVIGSASGAGVKAYLDSTADEGIADTVLNRNIAGGGNGTGATTDRTVRSALRTLRNKSAIVGTTLTVYAEDDTATAWTATVSSSATADPVTGIDPA